LAERFRFIYDDAYAKTPDSNRHVFKYVLRNRRDFLHYMRKNYKVYFNPVFAIGGGYDRTFNSNSTDFFQNTRGASIRAGLWGKVGVYADLTDNQISFPQFIDRYVRRQQVVFGEGYFKYFKQRSYDFFNYRGYVTYSPVKQLRIKFGRDRAFWGNGYQSLVLSDHATDYLLLNLTTRLWKLEYVNHFAQMIDFIPNKPDALGAYPRKYAVFHQLCYRPDPRISIGLFESVIYASSLPNGGRGFEIQYLNPVIFYRAVEQYIGSSDNASIGLTLKINVLRRFQLYGQWLIDDYNLGQTKLGKGWWGNKIAWQAGLKYIDVLGISNFDLQLETNRIRPYTFSHYNTASNYTHFGQHLTHPLGANLHDVHFILRYNPVANLFLQTTFSYTAIGLDYDGLNFGSNIFLPDLTHNNGAENPDFGNFTLQGKRENIAVLWMRADYRIWKWNAFVFVESAYRNESLERFSSVSLFVGIRWNLPGRRARI
ncbi:MAG: hypothetical protein RMM53_11075, partial [Bacteroidia bacterium]|nr:hypothetical protein [Bacteroidia bacterium]